MDSEQGQVEKGLGDEVAVRDGVQRVLESAGEPEVRGGPVRIKGQRRPGEGPGPERGHVEAGDGGEQPVDVAGQGPAVGQQVVGEQHGLGPLQVGVARQIGLSRLLGPGRQYVLEVEDLTSEHVELALGVEPEVRRHLVVAAPPGVELRPDVAGQLRHPPFDGGVDVLVVGREGEAAGVELGLHEVEGVEQGRHLLLGQEFTTTEAAHVGPRAGDVIVGQAAVDVEADRVVHHHVRGAAAQAAVPERHRPVRSPPRPSWTADQVATPRPQRRTKPSASWWRKVSEAS